MRRIKTLVLLFVLAVSAALLAIPSLAIADDISPKQLEFFEKKIRPVLIDKCYSCHSKDSKAAKGGLVLDTREGIRTGGDSGHAVVPGDLEASLILDAIRYEYVEMPPKEQLPESVIKHFEEWVRMGAPDPREGESLIKREINFEEAKKHWSFQPVKKPELPRVNRMDWPISDVDHFVLAKLEEEKLEPVVDANRLTLVRRIYFDLIGLPPTPKQLEALMADDSEDFVEKLVDDLLATPQFGEKWARHWLDVVRYAESNGRERNFVYPAAWRYRDYVIDAFNSDKPFNEFVREQVAGDLMNAEDLDASPQTKNERTIATGFLAIGPKLLNEGNKNKFLMDMVDEQVDVTTRAFTSLTVSCARCHDHKFDPIPTAEYYSMAGIFRSTQTLYGTAKRNGNRQASTLASLASTSDNPDEEAAAQALTKKELGKIAKQLLADRKKQKALQAQLKKAQKAKKQTDIARSRRLLNETRQRVKQLVADQKRVQSNGYQDQAMAVKDGKVQDSPIYIRGEATSPKGKSPRGFLTIMNADLKQELLETKQSGRRELAEWIVDRNNTLTSRVIVNRVWNQLFGRGIVRTVDNFGATGEQPTHPELLDFLAAEFVEDGWSIKSLVRRLVLTRTYQLSSKYESENYGQDPDNRMLWRRTPKRIDAEALRDAILTAGGNLNLEPAVSSPVSKLQGEFNVQRHLGMLRGNGEHRSVYLPIVRNAVPESLKLFDFAEPSIIVGDRSVTTVPTQALFFLNSKFVTKQCDLLATLLLKDETLDDQSRVDMAYRTILSRPALDSEVARASAFIQNADVRLAAGAEQTSKTRQHAWSGFCQALFGTAEFRYVD